MIDPAVLKGFRDSLPGDEIPKKRITRILEDVFTSYGFVPIDTPVLEYTEVLLTITRRKNLKHIHYKKEAL